MRALAQPLKAAELTGLSPTKEATPVERAEASGKIGRAWPKASPVHGGFGSFLAGLTQAALADAKWRLPV